MGKIRYLIVSIPDLCTLTYFNLSQGKISDILIRCARIQFHPNGVIGASAIEIFPGHTHMFYAILISVLFNSQHTVYHSVTKCHCLFLLVSTVDK